MSWDIIKNKIILKKAEFDRIHVCLKVTKNLPVKEETFNNHLSNIIQAYNDIIIEILRKSNSLQSISQSN